MPSTKCTKKVLQHILPLNIFLGGHIFYGFNLFKPVKKLSWLKAITGTDGIESIMFYWGDDLYFILSAISFALNRSTCIVTVNKLWKGTCIPSAKKKQTFNVYEQLCKWNDNSDVFGTASTPIMISVSMNNQSVHTSKNITPPGAKI